MTVAKSLPIQTRNVSKSLIPSAIKYQGVILLKDATGLRYPEKFIFLQSVVATPMAYALNPYLKHRRQ